MIHLAGAEGAQGWRRESAVERERGKVLAMTVTSQRYSHQKLFISVCVCVIHSFFGLYINCALLRNLRMRMSGPAKL